jgi:hypothetical protein
MSYVDDVANATVSSGIDIICHVQPAMNTQWNNILSGAKILGGVNPIIYNKNLKCSNEIAYKAPIYIHDISSISSIRIILADSLSGLQLTNGANMASPAYSLMLKVTPFYS